jgi:hypothetical protein
LDFKCAYVGAVATERFRQSRINNGAGESDATSDATLVGGGSAEVLAPINGW